MVVPVFNIHWHDKLNKMREGSEGNEHFKKVFSILVHI